MAKNKDAARLAIAATDMLIKRNSFSHVDDLNKRMILIAIIERGLYECALSDRDLEMDSIEEEERLHEAGEFQFDCLKISIDCIDVKSIYPKIDELYLKMKKEVLDAERKRRNTDGAEVDGLDRDQDQIGNVRTPKSGPAVL